jgi:hypothetical protein
MAYEDQALTCVDCGQEFTFTASQQQSFADKALTPPKRCYECRVAKRQRQGARRPSGDSVYRGPAFQDSAPAPRGRGASPRNGEYRSPAFRDLEQRGEGMYRSPAFRDRANGDDEYRSPAFREQTVAAESEYRAPGFQNERRGYTSERPMFVLVCSACGERSMVPYLPDEYENPTCDACSAPASGGEEKV